MGCSETKIPALAKLGRGTLQCKVSAEVEGGATVKAYFDGLK